MLVYIGCNGVILYRVKFGLSAYVIARGIKQVALRWTDFFQFPIIITGIIRRDKVSIAVGGKHINKFAVLIDAVLGSGKRTIALRPAPCYSITLCNLYPKLFENIRKFKGHISFYKGKSLTLRLHTCRVSFDFAYSVSDNLI